MISVSTSRFFQDFLEAERLYYIMGKKKITSIRVDEDVLKRTKEIGLNVSKVPENTLKDYIEKL